MKGLGLGDQDGTCQAEVLYDSLFGPWIELPIAPLYLEDKSLEVLHSVGATHFISGPIELECLR